MDRLSIVQTLTIESLEDIGRCASREAFEQDRLGAEADRKTGGVIVMGGATALSARSRPASAQDLDDLLGANRRVDGGWHKRNSSRKFRFAPRMPPPLLPDQRGLLRPMPLLPRERRTLDRKRTRLNSSP